MKTTLRIWVTTLTDHQLNGTAVFANWQQVHSAPQVFVGLSGGLDSKVLISLLLEVLEPERICAVHVNHGLSENADCWQAQTKTFCDAQGIKIHAESVVVTPDGEGVEAAARRARYAVFERLLAEQGLLLLGHHADDQAETVLFHLLRGSGVKGLSGIPAQRSLGQGKLIRPLLAWKKSELLAYAQHKGLSWVEDESNQQDKFDRNYLRNQVMPKIAQRWPGYVASIQSSARQSAEADQLAGQLANEDLSDLDVRAERAGWSICIEALQALETLRQKNILRHWPAQFNLPVPNHKIIDQIMLSLLDAEADAEPLVSWRSLHWRRFQGRLYLLPSAALTKSQDQVAHWVIGGSHDQRLRLADGSCLVAVETQGEGLVVTSGEDLTVRYRRGGERCTPAGRAHSNSLKKLFLEYRIEPWWRDRMPLLYVGETLVAVGDCWVCEGWQAEPGQRGKKISWQPNSL